VRPECPIPVGCAGERGSIAALQMDPERRRKLAELARWHDEREYWMKAGEIMGMAPWPPPPQKEQELKRKAREFLGMDPETGERRD
jgi:hypothetical protein